MQSDVKPEDKVPDTNAATDKSEKLKFDTKECEKADAEKMKRKQLEERRVVRVIIVPSTVRVAIVRST